MHSFAELVFLVYALNASLAAPSAVTVNWWTPNDIGAIVKSAEDCGKQKTAATFTATLMICPERDPHARVMPGMSRRCTSKQTRELSIDDRSGVLSFTEVPVGLHMLLFKAGSLQPVQVPLRVYGGQQDAQQVEVKWLTVFGTVTRGGRPVHARVFNSVATDPATGRYTAALTRLPGADPMMVAPCDGSREYWFIPERAPAENAAFDIELPANRLEVEFVDAVSGQPVKGVPANYAAVRSDRADAAHFNMSAGRSDANGRLIIEPLVPNRPVRICARAEEYESVCSEPFTIKPNESKSLRIALTKAVVREGRVLTPGRSRVIWHNLTGMTEMVNTDEEGRFKYKRPHAEGEIVTVFSNAGFYAFVQPRIEDGQLFDITLPNVRRRTFEVAMPRSSREQFGFFTIALGDLIVPDFGFSQYLMERRQQPALQPGWSTVVSDVFETGPISIIYVSGASAKGSDWAVRPEARSLPRRALGENGRVSIE
jgi:hypothetical protein